MLRTVALLDILGFRELIAETPLQELVDRYEKAVAISEKFLIHPMMDPGDEPALFRSASPAPLCQRYVFSDTVVLISDDDSDESCAKLLVYTWRLVQGLLAFRFAPRGGIAFGEMYVNPAKQIFLGSALTAAYELEQRQDWAGVALSDSLATKIRNTSRNPALSSIVRHIIADYEVPMKTGGGEVLKTLNWRFNLVVKAGTRSLFSETGDPAASRKIDNTLRYAKAMRPTAYHQSDKDVPIELKTLFVGDSPPPPDFTHGDDL